MCYGGIHELKVETVTDARCMKEEYGVSWDL